LHANSDLVEFALVGRSTEEAMANRRRWSETETTAARQRGIKSTELAEGDAPTSGTGTHVDVRVNQKALRRVLPAMKGMESSAWRPAQRSTLRLPRQARRLP